MSFKKKDAVKAYGFAVRPSQIAELRKIAKRKNRSVSRVVRFAIAQYLKNEGARHVQG